MRKPKQKQFYDCLAVIVRSDKSETCLKFSCESFDEAIKILSNTSNNGKVVSFMFGDFHTIIL